MYATLARLKSIVEDITEIRDDDDLTERYINQAISIIETERDFDALNMTETITPDSSGVIISPPLCRKINNIYPSDSELRKDYRFKAQEELYTDGDNRLLGRYYLTDGIYAGAEETFTVNVVKGSNTVNINSGETSWFDADDVGNLVLFDNSSYFYKITAVVTTEGSETITIEPRYYGANRTAETAINSPAALQEFKLIYADGNTDSAVTDAVSVNYQRFHPPLIRQYDPLLIPAMYTVAFTAIQIGMMSAKYDVDATRIEGLIQKYKRSEYRQEPRTRRQSIPQSMNGGAPMFAVKTRNDY